MGLLLRKSAAGFPVGTVHQWKSGKARKVAPNKWQLLEQAGQGSLFGLPEQPPEKTPEELAAEDWKANGIRSKAFKAWFGDWESHDPKRRALISKVRDRDGRPKLTWALQDDVRRIPRQEARKQGAAVTVGPEGPVRVFHGSAATFDAFDPKRADPAGLYGPGLYFTEDKEVAQSYQTKGGRVYAEEITPAMEVRLRQEVETWRAGAARMAETRGWGKVPDKQQERLDTMLQWLAASEQHKKLTAARELKNFLGEKILEEAGVIQPQHLFECFLNIRNPFNAEGDELRDADKLDGYAIARAPAMLEHAKKTELRTSAISLDLRVPVPDLLATVGEDLAAKLKLEFGDVASVDVARLLCSQLEHTWRVHGKMGAVLQLVESAVVKAARQLPERASMDRLDRAFPWLQGYEIKPGERAIVTLERARPDTREELLQAHASHALQKAAERRARETMTVGDAEWNYEDLSGVTSRTTANQILQELGYDGITHVGGMRAGGGEKKHRVWIAFKANQVKAVDNHGTFDPKSDNIYKSKGYAPGTVRNWRTGPAKKKADGTWEQLREQAGGRMFVMTTPGKTARGLVAGGEKGIAYFVTPQTGNDVRKVVQSGQPWAADNAAYSDWYPEKFQKMAEKIATAVSENGYRNAPIFVAVPDVVGDHDHTLARFWEYAHDLGGTRDGLHLPLAFVVQNGSETEYRLTSTYDAGEHTRGIPWDRISAIFVGGDTAWKLSEGAKEIVREAKARGKWVHVGRVNSSKRAEIAARFGADSFDGSSTSMFPAKKLPERLADTARLRQGQTDLFKAGFPPGTVRRWRTGSFRKQPDGTWTPVEVLAVKRKPENPDQLGLFDVPKQPAPPERKPANPIRPELQKLVSSIDPDDLIRAVDPARESSLRGLIAAADPTGGPLYGPARAAERALERAARLDKLLAAGKGKGPRVTGLGKNVRYERTVDSSAGDRGPVADVEQAVFSLPRWIQEALHDVEIKVVPQSKWERHVQKFDPELAVRHDSIGGFYDSLSHSVHLVARNRLRNSTLHELGHAFDYSLAGGAFDAASTPREAELAKIWPWLTSSDAISFITAYARTNAREDVAECFAFLQHSPTNLQRSCPKKYETIKRATESRDSLLRLFWEHDHA